MSDRTPAEIMAVAATLLARFAPDASLYVALTRTGQRLGVLHRGPLPHVPSRLSVRH